MIVDWHLNYGVLLPSNVHSYSCCFIDAQPHKAYRALADWLASKVRLTPVADPYVNLDSLFDQNNDIHSSWIVFIDCPAHG